MFVRPGVGGGVQLHSGAALLRGLGVDLGFAQPMRRVRTENQTPVHLTQRTHLTHLHTKNQKLTQEHHKNLSQEPCCRWIRASQTGLAKLDGAPDAGLFITAGLDAVLITITILEAGLTCL